MDKQKPTKYWYLYEHEECVYCWKHATTKRRIYDRPKPERVEERHIEKDVSCGCHFC